MVDQVLSEWISTHLTHHLLTNVSSLARARRGISIGVVHSQYDSNGKRILVRHVIAQWEKLWEQERRKTAYSLIIGRETDKNGGVRGI